MKVLRLRFKNIHSLKGEHFLDFTVPPLADAGLFAIIGPTGAGKSTILDVITLSLFNKIPRFASKGTESISKPEIEKMGSVMTHFTDDAYAQIDYQTHQGIFRSTWRISKARTGNLRDYEMQLAELLPDATEKEIFDLKKSQVPDRNELLLGLKYEQFIRSILLSQGDFARLLKSDDKERAALLEDITDTSIYRNIGKKTFELAKLKRQEIENLRTQLSFYKHLSGEEIQSKQTIIAEYQERNISMDITVTEIQENIKNLSQQLHLTSRMTEIKNAFDLLQHRKDAYLHKAEKLKRHQELDIYREQFSIWQMDKKSWQNTSLEVSNLQEEYKQVANDFAKVIREMSAFTGQHVDDHNFMNIMKQFEQEVISLDYKLESITQNGRNSRQRLLQLLSKEGNTRWTAFGSMKPQEGIQEVDRMMTEYQKIAENNDIEKLSKLKNDISENREKLLQVHNIVKQLEKNKSENAQMLHQINQLNDSIVEVSKVLTNYEKESQIIEQKLIELNNEKEKWLQIASLDEHRSNLEDGQPCPLCGSVHHPYAKELPVRVLDLDLEIRAKNQQSTKIKEEIKSLTINISRDQSTVFHSQQVIAKNNEEIDVLTQEIGDQVKTSEQIFDEISKTEKELIDTNAKIEALSHMQTLDSVRHIMSEMVQLLEEHASIHSKRQSLYKGTNVADDANMIQNQYSALKAKSERLTATIKTKESDASRIFVKWTDMTKKLEKEVLLLGYQTIEDAINNLLPDDTLRQYLAEKEALNKEETSLIAQFQQAETDFNSIKHLSGDQKTLEDFKEKVAELQREKDNINTLIGAISNEIEQDALKRKEALDLMNVISIKEQQANPYLYLNELIGDQFGNKYAKFAQNISLKHLISLANQRLSKLTDRYLLKMTDIEEDFRVVDLYQAGIDRSVKTLSGGETFIVSLALALSLSDMASQNVKLESLFIDEGFGTLDQETLETAMITLEKLQSESKRNIGIISHVESLKERITTQIRVLKNSQGYSILEVV